MLVSTWRCKARPTPANMSSKNLWKPRLYSTVLPPSATWPRGPLLTHSKVKKVVRKKKTKNKKRKRTHNRSRQNNNKNKKPIIKDVLNGWLNINGARWPHDRRAKAFKVYNNCKRGEGKIRIVGFVFMSCFASWNRKPPTTPPAFEALQRVPPVLINPQERQRPPPFTFTSTTLKCTREKRPQLYSKVGKGKNVGQEAALCIKRKKK